MSKINPWRISAITYIELAQGCRSKEELQRAKRGLERKDRAIFPQERTTNNVPRTTNHTHALSDGLQVADALIAATAIEQGSVLLTTFNTNHQSPITSHGLCQLSMH